MYYLQKVLIVTTFLLGVLGSDAQSEWAAIDLDG